MTPRITISVGDIYGVIEAAIGWGYELRENELACPTENHLKELIDVSAVHMAEEFVTNYEHQIKPAYSDDELFAMFKKIVDRIVSKEEMT